MKRASVWLLLLCVIFTVTAMVTGVAANALPEDEMPTYVAITSDGSVYASLQSAVNATQAGDTITLLDNVTTAEAVVIDKTIVLDGAGYTLTSTAGRAIDVNCEGDVEIKNLTVVSGADCSAINVLEKPAGLTLTGVTVSDAGVSLDIAASGAMVTVNESTLTAATVINISEGCTDVTLNVNGGALNAAASSDAVVLAICPSATGATVALDTALTTDGDFFGIYVMIDEISVALRAEYADALLAEGFTTDASEIEGLVELKSKAFAMIGDTPYNSFAEALAAAQENGGTVKLFADVITTNLVVTEGVAIDLGGYKLTTNYIVVFNGAYILDSSDDNSGLLVCPKASAIFAMQATAEDGVIATEQAPLWDASQNGYVFVQFAFAGMSLTEETLEDESTVLAYRFAFLTEKGIARDLLADGGSDNDLSVVIRLSWKSGDNTEIHDFVASDALVGEVVSANGTRQFVLSVGNYAEFENLTFQAMIFSGNQLVATTSGLLPN